MALVLLGDGLDAEIGWGSVPKTSTSSGYRSVMRNEDSGGGRTGEAE